MRSKISSSNSRSTLFGSGRKANLLRWGGIALVLLVAYLFFATGGNDSQLSQDDPFFEVKRGPLSVTVLTSGSIRSSQAETIHNKVVDIALITWIIVEGSFVKEGDLLLEIDPSQLEDLLLEEDIRVEMARAELVSAEEGLELEKKEGQALIRKSRVDLLLGILDFEKYAGVSVAKMLGLDKALDHPDTDLYQVGTQLREMDLNKLDLEKFSTEEDGEYEQLVQKAENKITLAKAELKRAKDQMDGSRTLAQKG